jgi:hypothetical protein
MTQFAEPLEVPMGRTLLALANWARTDSRQNLTVVAASSADFALRFPLILGRLYGASGRELGIGVTAQAYELAAPENDQLEAQYQAWESRHRLVIGALVGRGLATLAPGAMSQRIMPTALGARSAARLAAQPGWSLVQARAKALNSLRLSPHTLTERCRAAVGDER